MTDLAERWQLPIEHRKFFYSCFQDREHPHGYFERLEHLFPGQTRFALELGSGKGDFMMDFCARNPEVVLIGVEKKWSRVKIMAKKVARLGLVNAFVLQGLIEQVLERGFGSIHFENIFMNYPDPWPKNPQKKHRTARVPGFFQNLRGVLAPGGVFTFASDALDYVKEVAQVLKNDPGFQNCHPTDLVHSLPGYHRTLFEQYALKEGLRPGYLRFQRINRVQPH